MDIRGEMELFVMMLYSSSDRGVSRSTSRNGTNAMLFLRRHFY